MVDLKKAREIMIEFYSPKPDFFEVWYEEKEEMYRSIAEFNEGDEEIFLGTWNDDYDAQDEIIIDKKVYSKIKSIMECGRKMAINISETNDMLLFLIETSPETHKEIIHALDYASSYAANRGSRLGRVVYYRTKKDVFEYKRKKPYEALINKNVMKFAANNFQMIRRLYRGKIEHLKRYIQICANGGK